MKIRTKLILNYSILSVALLLLFSSIITFSYIKYRLSDFSTRLHNRAISSLYMLTNQNSIDSTMLRIIDNSIITTMKDLQISIYDKNDKLIYCYHDAIRMSAINFKYKSENSIENFLLPGYKTIKFNYVQSNNEHKLIASAYDIYGVNELHKILSIIFWVFILSVVFIIGFGFYNAVWSLKPFRKVISEVEEIGSFDLKKRLSAIGSDEISQLSQTFNNLLDRIEKAFETEKSFISNASHELRTPVTSVMGQIEVILNKTRNEEEYKAVLQSVYDDTNQMANIINGFLDLAEANLASDRIEKSNVRIDELLFSIANDFEKRKPYYNISIEYTSYPEYENQIECLANIRLLRLMFSNLIDNACKYSEDKKAIIKIDFNSTDIIVSINDHGIGITKDDYKNIFDPLFRGENTTGINGHGIGLAIVKRIAELHNVSIAINSEINIGTSVTVSLKVHKNKQI